jgi:hypothetical protein
MDVIDGTPSSLTLASAGVILHRALHLKDVMHMRVEVACEASDGVELVHVNATSVGVIAHVQGVRMSLPFFGAEGTAYHEASMPSASQTSR